MSKPTVLVAEDESALVTLLRYNLEREGYRVLEARDGEEALLIAAEEQPDLVILDWMMPQLSGIEVCRRLRSRQETRNVPILMLTARGAPAHATKFRAVYKSFRIGCSSSSGLVWGA